MLGKGIAEGKNKDLSKIKLGGYIRCVNMNEELKWGGILIKN